MKQQRLYRNENGNPTLFVAEGETVTISVSREHAKPAVKVLNLRPRTTAALLVLAGIPSQNGPRLSDQDAFEQIKTTADCVNLLQVDQTGRIDGYSISFLRGLLEGFNPKDKAPPASVRRLIPREPESQNYCRCAGSASERTPRGSALAIDTHDPVLGQTTSSAPHNIRESFVPDFLVNLKAFCPIVRLYDVIVSRNATLILDSDISFAWADNFLAYYGSRIVQRAPYLNLDVTGTMRGSISSIVQNIATDIVKINWSALRAQAPTKP
jgi:hypothetical protein